MAVRRFLCQVREKHALSASKISVLIVSVRSPPPASHATESVYRLHALSADAYEGVPQRA